jgi:nucleoside-diphosphate-sugar epimerase
MNILITGGAGYVGSVLARLLLARGHRVRVLDSLLHGGSPLLGLYAADGFEFFKGDVRSDADVDAALSSGIDAVVHLAAIVGDPACARQPETAREVNVAGSLRLLHASRACGVKKFIFASTCSNYGRMPDPSFAATEESPLRPVSLYAETKVLVEQTILEQFRGDMTVTLMRFATVFGASPRMRFDLTVNEFTRDLLLKGRLEVYGEQFWRPYIHVADAARGIQTALEADGKIVSGKVFNVGDSQQNYTKRHIVEMVRERVGREIDVSYCHKNEDPRDYRVGFEKINRELGFTTRRTVAAGIEEIIGLLRQDVIADPYADCYRN